MIENLINFVKSRTFIYSVSGVVLLFGVLSLLNYLNDQKNQEEFLQFVEINEEFSNETETAEDLFKRLDLEYQNFGYELITKSVLAKKALDEESFELALKIYLDISQQLKSSGIANATKNVLKEQYAENIVRLQIELDRYDDGKLFLEQSDLKSPRFYELGGDFYKSFGENELANEWYDKALDSDLNETQKNLIELKKPFDE